MIQKKIENKVFYEWRNIQNETNLSYSFLEIQIVMFKLRATNL